MSAREVLTDTGRRDSGCFVLCAGWERRYVTARFGCAGDLRRGCFAGGRARWRVRSGLLWAHGDNRSDNSLYLSQDRRASHGAPDPPGLRRETTHAADASRAMALDTLVSLVHGSGKYGGVPGQRRETFDEHDYLGNA